VFTALYELNIHMKFRLNFAFKDLILIVIIPAIYQQNAHLQ